jgi:hypothetical protein
MRDTDYFVHDEFRIQYQEENLKIVSEFWILGPGHLIKKGHPTDAPLHFKHILGIGP